MQLALNAKERPAISAGRWYLERVALGVALLALAGEIVLTVGPRLGSAFGNDLWIVRDATRAFLDGAPLYNPAEVAAPFQLYNGVFLYPPIAILLFAPFLVLPPLLWWAIPIGIVGWVVWSYRPSVLGWAGVVACIALPYTVPLVLAGNPSMWIAAAFALGLRYRWPAVLVLLKPSLFPFAFIGVRSRGWWIGLAVLGVLSLPFLSETFDYLAVLRNVRHADGLLYSLTNVPLMLIPLIASGSAVSLRHGRRQMPRERGTALDNDGVRDRRAVGVAGHGHVG